MQGNANISKVWYSKHSRKDVLRPLIQHEYFPHRRACGLYVEVRGAFASSSDRMPVGRAARSVVEAEKRENSICLGLLQRRRRRLFGEISFLTALLGWFAHMLNPTRHSQMASR